jgi:hypothetical protein
VLVGKKKTDFSIEKNHDNKLNFNLPCTLVETNSEEQDESDSRAPDDEEPGQVGLGRTAGVGLARRDGPQPPHHQHEQADGEAAEVEDAHAPHLPLLAVREEARAPGTACPARRHRAVTISYGNPLYTANSFT